MFFGNIFDQYGFKVDVENIKSIIEWHHPKNLIELRGFNHICTYYSKFVKGFSQLTSPLIDLKKKDDLQWHEEAENDFQRIKEVMSSCPILALPIFPKPFVLECDASGEGIRVVLKQGQHPIDFESRKIHKHDNLYSIYDK